MTTPGAAGIDEALLRQVPLLAALPAAELRQMAAALQRHDHAAQALIYVEGEEGDRLSLIVTRQVQVVTALGTPDERVLAVKGPGDFLGEMSLLLGDRRRTASLRSLTPVTLLELSRPDFDALLLRQPALAMELVRELIVRFRRRSARRSTICRRATASWRRPMASYKPRRPASWRRKRWSTSCRWPAGSRRGCYPKQRQHCRAGRSKPIGSRRTP